MATKVFTGGAKAIAQVTTVTVAGVWAEADTATITVNGKDVVVTVGAANFTTDNVATAVKDAINASAALDGTGNTDATSDVGGQEISEFTELIATVAASVVTVKTTSTVHTNFPGKPFTMTAVAATAGTGDVTVATPTTATGPHHADNADNWDTGSVPVSTDDVVFDHRALYDCLYGLDFSAVQPASTTITNGFRKKIGLNRTNADNASKKYPEYRTTALTFNGSTVIRIHGEGAGSERINLALGATNASTIDIASNGRRSGGGDDTANLPVILITGTVTTNVLRVTKGDVGVAFFDGETAHLATLHVGPDGGAKVRLGAGCDIGDATITQSGGELTIDSATATGSITVTGGTLNVESGAHAAITCDGGQVNYRSSGTLTTGICGGGGSFEFSTDKARTVTNMSLHAGAKIRDPSKTVTVTNGYDYQRCGLKDVDADIGEHFTLTPSAI